MIKKSKKYLKNLQPLLVVLILLFSLPAKAQVVINWKPQANKTDVMTGTAVIGGQTVTATMTVTINNSPTSGGTFNNSNNSVKNLVRGDSWSASGISGNAGTSAANLGVSNDTDWVICNNDPLGFPNIISIKFDKDVVLKTLAISDLDQSYGVWSESFTLSGFDFDSVSSGAFQQTTAPTVTTSSVSFGGSDLSGTDEVGNGWAKFNGSKTLPANTAVQVNFQGYNTTYTKDRSNKINGFALFLSAPCTPPTITGNTTLATGATSKLSGSDTAAPTNPWTSSNTSVATVSSTGLVTGVAPGTSTITYTNSSGCSATTNVTVQYACSGSTNFSGVWSGASGTAITDANSTTKTTGAFPITITMSSPAANDTGITFTNDAPLAPGNGYLNATSSTSNTGGTSGATYYYYTPNLTFKNALKFTAIFDADGNGTAGTRKVTFTFSKPVKNFILNVDRLGGFENVNGKSSNSSLWTLLTSGVSMTKLSGNSVFNVDSTSKTFYRSVADNQGQNSNGEVDSVTPVNGTAAGSIYFSSSTAFDTLTFSFNKTGLSGNGTDGVEFLFEFCEEYCYKKPSTGTSLPTTHGITSLGRAGSNSDNWPMVRNGAWTVLEAKNKGFVVNRVATPETTIANPVEGMMVWDTTAKCLKAYFGATAGWSCLDNSACGN